jgi:hypothetical protein
MCIASLTLQKTITTSNMHQEYIEINTFSEIYIK